VNPVVSGRPEPGRARGRRHDVVMHALHAVAKEERPIEREARTGTAALAWLARQGEQHGFTPEPGSVAVDGHDQVRLPRGAAPTGAARPNPIAFTVLTLAGVLTVHEPEPFLARLVHGFGAAKAFGCGLMLIRAAHGTDAADAVEDDLA
jgi:CRISPR system Cascade subunit CasE